jgi:hypothetical protein
VCRGIFHDRVTLRYWFFGASRAPKQATGQDGDTLRGSAKQRREIQNVAGQGEIKRRL